jgi:signal transduction histidine kinase
MSLDTEARPGASAATGSPHPTEHPRTIGWFGTTALAMGGSNQSLFLISGLMLTQGSGAVPLLIVGLLLSLAAAPGWIELSLMWPNRVGGIAATCAEAFRPYSAVLANLTGVCYWWGWVPTCGLTAILSGSALHQWYLPMIPVPVLAVAIVVLFTALNLAGIKWVTRLAKPIAIASACLAFASSLIPVAFGTVDWQRSFDFHLVTPFHGLFGGVTSAMAGLYLIGFAAPAFEAATCHVGETIDPVRNVRRAVWASAGMAGVYFVLIPVVWMGVLGTEGIAGDLALTLGPTFAPLLGGVAKAAAIWFMVLNMFHGTLQPLAGAARTLSQLSEDGLLPRAIARRSRTDVPWVATTLTAGMAIAFLLAGDPVWMIAAANFTYLIGIGLPSVAVWLLRRHSPQMLRPWRAPRGTIMLGVVAAGGWGVSTILGFQQFGLPTVLFGLGLAYSGSVLYAWRTVSDRRRAGLPVTFRSMHLKLTGAMVLVMIMDGAGYLIAVASVDAGQESVLVTVLEDIFVAVAILTISVGLILPGTIAHAAGQLAGAADRLAKGTLADLTRAMQALAAGRLDEAHARVDDTAVVVHTRDEIGEMAANFTIMQGQIVQAAMALDDARGELRAHREHLEDLVGNRTKALAEANVEIESRLCELQERDATLRVAMDELAQVEEQRRHLLAQTIRSKEDERTRLAAELHDGPIQRLTAIGYGFEEACLILDMHGPEQSTPLLSLVRTQLKNEIDGLRGLMTELRPPALDEQGLRLALQDLADGFSRRTSLSSSVSIDLDVRLDRDAETVLYRVVQEALVNVAKHAQASHIDISVECVGGEVVLSVEDDGVGFDPSGAPGLVARGHFGLAGMRERVELAGGRYCLDSGVGLGTTVRAWLPVQELAA